MDVVALQVVTVGQKATERFDALQEAGEFAEAYYFHGLAVQMAEATADYLHAHIRRELNLQWIVGNDIPGDIRRSPNWKTIQKYLSSCQLDQPLG